MEIYENNVSNTTSIFRKENLQGQSVLCYLPYGCIGRDKEYRELEQAMKDGIPIVLNGVAGIGKNAFCSYYYRRQREINPDFFMLYVDLSGCEGLENFIQSVSNAIDIDSSADLKYIVEYLLDYRANYQVIVFDNWEEFQYTVMNTTSWELICNYLNLLAYNGICVLILSQEKISNGWKKYELNELQEKDGQILFEQLLLRQGKKIKKADIREYQAFKYLLNCMENHPLTMVLTASLVEGEYYDLSRLEGQWSKAYNETEAGKHRSLRTALALSFDAVSSVGSAVLLWGIISNLTIDFPASFMELLQDTLPDIVWDEAERVLVRRCLVNNTEFQSLHMLLPVKQQWKNLATSKLQDICLEKWGTLLPVILESSNASGYTHDPQKSNPIKKDVLLAIDDFFRITKILIEKDMIAQAEICLGKMEPYYELVAERGSRFLEGLPIKKFSQEIQGTIYRCRADIIRLKEPDNPKLAQIFYEKALICFEECGSECGIAYTKNTMGLNYLWNYKNRKKAMEFFKASEKIARTQGYDLCLAETLKNQGVLLSNKFEKNEEAKKCYEEAELIYEKIGDYRGIAHVTKRRGVIECEKGNIDLAIKYFEKALYFYQQTHYMQGVADTISRLCLAYMSKGNEEKLYKMYKAGKNLYDRIPYEVTRKDLKKNIELVRIWFDGKGLNGIY